MSWQSWGGSDVEHLRHRKASVGVGRRLMHATTAGVDAALRGKDEREAQKQGEVSVQTGSKGSPDWARLVAEVFDA